MNIKFGTDKTKTKLEEKITSRENFVLLLIITIIGSIIRLYFVFQSNFPINDGGFFFSLVKDLAAAHFRLPLFATYNNLSIPFAYPPLSFYLVGFLNYFLKIDLLQLFRFLPVVFSIASIPAFYFLSKQWLIKDSEQLLATFTFAVLRPVYIWQIMGGGIARSTAFFFMLIALAFYSKFIKNRTYSSLIWTILFSSLTLLCHLEIFWSLVLANLVILLCTKISLRKMLTSLAAFFFVAALTSVWWARVISAHGIDIFFRALQSGEFNLLKPIYVLLTLSPAEDMTLGLFSVLGFIGLIYALLKKDRTIPVLWLVFIFFDPRSASRSAMIPIALLAGLAMNQLMERLSTRLQSQAETSKEIDPKIISRPLMILSVCLLVYALFNNWFANYLFSNDHPLTVLNSENRTAMKWISENVSDSGRFLIMDNYSAWEMDSVSEWFPQLTSRQSLLTVQGTEWLPDQRFKEIQDIQNSLWNCRDRGITCFDQVADQNHLKFDYVYFTPNSQQTHDEYSFTSPLEVQISTDSNYKLVYSNIDVRIYQKLN